MPWRRKEKGETGPTAPDLKDDFGFPVQPRNLTRKWYFRGGHEPDDIYLRFNTGLAGTPMPAFDTSLNNEKSWDLANYIVSLSPAKKPDLKFVVKAKRIAGELPKIRMTRSGKGWSYSSFLWWDRWSRTPGISPRCQTTWM